ncbi:MAG: glycosyltransferase family 4 protein [Terriglobales bacterium]
MPTIAYLSNLFPSPVEPYVIDEIRELRRRGVTVVPCSARRVKPGLERHQQSFAAETLYLQPLRVAVLVRAACLCVAKLAVLSDFLRRALFQGREPPGRRLRALVHTLLGFYYAALLGSRRVEHIHVHHGYFGSWIAMVAARLLGIGFSMTLHGSDLLLDAAFLDLKLERCSFCVTISEFNRRHILKHYPNAEPQRILVRRMGVDAPVIKRPSSERNPAFSMLAVGRLHPVKDHPFLIQACWLLKCRGLRFVCRIAGEGPERQSLEGMIRDFDLRSEVRLLGQLSREQLDEQYEQADLVVLTSRSEGIPLVLMEAMARGKPVLAPAITGIPELVADGKTGFLYRGGSLDDFMAGVTFVMKVQPALGPLLHAARAYVLKHFNRKPNLAAVCDLFTPYLEAQPAHLPDTSKKLRAPLMKILFCNKYNFPFSGTEAYLFELMDLLRSQGHEVALFSMADSRGESTAYDHHFVPHLDFKDSTAGWLARAKLGAHAVYSTDARDRLGEMVQAFQPDIAHVRNIYHHLSPSILWELKAQGIPTIYHLNDFKLLCPVYNMVTKGRACQQSCTGKYWKMISKGCYDGPVSSATVLMAEAYIHHWIGTYGKCVDHFLTPSQFAKQQLTQNGFSSEKITVLPHFQNLPEAAPPAPANAPILYFGRLSPEKGVDHLLRAMQALPQVRLQIAGDGPQRSELEGLARTLGLENVEFTGHLTGKDLERRIAAARFTILPSLAYETLGKSILESYAWQRPVVASDLGSRRELVREGETGLLYPPGDVEQLSGAISYLAQRPQQVQEMGAAGRQLVAARHSPFTHYQELMQLYEQVCQRARPPGAIRVVAAAQKRMRVAFIGGRGVVSKYSGIEAYYEEVGKRLVELGYDITVYCRTYFTPALDTYNGMRLVRLPTIRSKHLETLVHTLLSSIHAAFSGCDIVHYHAQGPALFSSLPQLFGKKTAVTVQGLDWRRKKWGRFASRVLRLGELASARVPDATMVVSHTLQEYYRLNYGIETTYVPNGATLRQRNGPAYLNQWNLEPDKYILFAGRLSPEKNCHLLIDAYEKLATSAKLVFAGGSSHTDAYAEGLRRRASDRVVFTDWVAGDALSELLTNAALFVLPSDLEGLSLALLEAMGAGTCVLTSDIPENREVVDGAGFTFRAGDVNDLTRMLDLLLSHERMRVTAARLALDRVRDQYQWSQIAKDISAAYEKLAGRDLAAQGYPALRPYAEPSSAPSKRAA